MFQIEKFPKLAKLRSVVGKTPLHVAVRRGYYQIAKILLTYDADPAAKDEAGHTPYDIATSLDNNDIFVMLQDAKAGTFVKDFKDLPS
jgi:ankyrin repeat protein